MNVMRFLSVIAILLLTSVASVCFAGECGPQDVLSSQAAGEQFGAAVAGAGDIDRDGVSDILVGASNPSGIGKVYLYSGGDRSLMHEFTGATSGDGFGSAVSTAGDVDGDGVEDVIVAAPDFDSSHGKVYVFSGADWSVLMTKTGAAVGDRLGCSVAGMGDLNDDGHADIAVAAPGDDGAGLDRGVVFIYSGVDQATLHTLTADAYTGFGFSIANGGDFDKDGYSDLIVGQPEYLANDGKVYVFSGHYGTLLISFVGEHSADCLGWSVAGIGDANGDGLDDIVVGIPFYDG